MKKRDVLKGTVLLLSVVLAVVLSGCEDKNVYPDLNPALQPTDQGVLIGEEGGEVTAISGNVVITIPSGALNAPTRFVVRDLMNKSAGIYSLKSIVIEPLVEFNKPVQLALKYDGCLETDFKICEAKSIMFSIWDDEADFVLQREPRVCSSCVLNEDSGSVSMCICQTGIVLIQAEW